MAKKGINLDNLIAQCSERLDVFLSSQLGISRNQISSLIKSAAVRVDGAVQTKPGYKLSAGELVHIDYPAPAPQQTSAERLNFDVKILYEDDDLLVVNKPAGLTVHPAASVKEPTLVDWLKSRGYLLSTLGGELRAGIVHRLDKLTSGALLVAKNNAAHAALSAQLSDKSMGRIYLALIDLPLKEPCVIERPIARNPANRLKMGIVPGGRNAKSAFYEILSGTELTELQNSAQKCDEILSTGASTAAGKSAGMDEILNDYAGADNADEISNSCMQSADKISIQSADKIPSSRAGNAGKIPNNLVDSADKILTAKMSADQTRTARLAENKFLNFKNPAQNYKLPPINLKSFNLVAAKLFTGRTHQIRVHLSSINRHILGDHLYGFKSENAKISRILLHAYLLYFIHPRSGKEVKICAGLPSEFLNFTTNQKVKDEIYEKILPTNVERYFSDISGWLRYV
ncbi:RluA family pseudouridine synthase [uncultured Campylobacter sp.]|uniref:RluA family pseudouridine synthase n=1 Tax=uncultured Campylobacter sp. TaxID=218934 RepID=UPI003426FAF5